MNSLTVPNNLTISGEIPIKFCSDSDIRLEITSKEEKPLKKPEKVKKDHNSIKEKRRLFSRLLSNKFLEIKFFLHLKSICDKILLMNLLAFFVLVLLIHAQIYVNQYIYCGLDNTNVLVVIYVLIREIFLVDYYYAIYYHYVVFSFIEGSSYVLLWILSVTSMIFYILKIYKIDPLVGNFDLYLSDMFFGFFAAAYYYNKFCSTWKELKRNLTIIVNLIVFTLLVHQYLMKVYVIPNVRLTLYFSQGKIVFQFLLFFYFKIYGMVLFKGLVICVKNSKPTKCDNCVMVVAKFYLLDAISCCLPAAVTEPLDSIECWLGMMNFLYQALVLYDPENNLIGVIQKFIYKCLKKQLPIKIMREEAVKVKNIISYSVKEVIIIVQLQVFLTWCFKRFLCSYSHGSKNCQFEMFDEIYISIENIFILFSFIMLLMFALIARKNHSSKINWNTQYFSVYFYLYFIILQHFLCDFNSQFYFYLYKLTKNNEFH